MSKKIPYSVILFLSKVIYILKRKRIWKEGEKENQIYCHKYHYSAMGK